MSIVSSVEHEAAERSVGRARHRARLLSVAEVTPSHFQIRLESPALAATALPGQFVHIAPVPNSRGLSFDPMLRRAFSIMSVNAPENTVVDVLFRVEGRGTQALATAQRGDEIDLIGPLGKPFDISPLGIPKSQNGTQLFHVKHSLGSAIVVGGGVGVPPLVYLSEMLSSAGVGVHALIGARSSSEIIGWDELSAVCHHVSVTTDDGSRGLKGRVTDILPSLFGHASTGEQSTKPVVYACGPWPMLRAVAQLCGQHQVRCQVSLEENMPCGIGVCNGCVVRTRQPFATENTSASDRDLNEIVGNEWSPYHAYRRVCIEGPACWADEIDWEHQG